MYAVIRTGGKQYKVSPGETSRWCERSTRRARSSLPNVPAVSSEEGKFEADLKGAKVTGTSALQ